eukprot:scaffold43744_cov36-Phaeocystis_antarctica.AAC.1
MVEWESVPAKAGCLIGTIKTQAAARRQGGFGRAPRDGRRAYELLARLGVAAAAAAVMTALWLCRPPPWLLARWMAPE